jgi:hypothetical protein
MPKATPTIASPSPEVPTPATPTPAIPSILAIGRMIRTMEARQRVVDERWLKAKDHKLSLDKELSRLSTRGEVLDDLIMTLPVENLAEVAVQLTVAFRLLDYVGGCEFDEDAATDVFLKLRRIVCGAFPIVRDAANLDADEIVTREQVELMAAEFGEHVA